MKYRFYTVHFFFMLVTFVFLTSCAVRQYDSGPSLAIGRGDLDSERKSGAYYTALNAQRNRHLPKGKPYTVRGESYTPYTSATNFEEIGIASWYGPGFHGKLTANGERYNQNGITAAHKLLPHGTMIRVTNLENGKSVVVRINDRGPFLHDRIIDLSKGAARKIDMVDSGTAKVHLAVAGGAPVFASGGSGNGGGSAVGGGSGAVNLAGGLATITEHPTYVKLFKRGGTLNNPDNPGGFGLPPAKYNRFGEPVGAGASYGSSRSGVYNQNSGDLPKSSGFYSDDPSEFGDDPTYYQNTSSRRSSRGASNTYSVNGQENQGVVANEQEVGEGDGEAGFFTEYDDGSAFVEEGYTVTEVDNTVPLAVEQSDVDQNGVDGGIPPETYDTAYEQDGGSFSRSRSKSYQEIVIPTAELSGNYYIEIGRFAEKRNANKLKRSLADGGLSTEIFHSGNNYLVYAGPYQNKNKAMQIKKNLDKHFPKSQVVVK